MIRVTIPFSFTVYAGQASEITYWLRVHADSGASFDRCAATGGLCNVAQIGESVATVRLLPYADLAPHERDRLVRDAGRRRASRRAPASTTWCRSRAAARRCSRRWRRSASWRDAARAVAALVAVSVSVAASQTASAAIFCATDETEFRAALASIGSSFDGADNEIRLTQRIFFNGGFVFSVQVPGPTGNLDVSGGWTTAGDTACDVQEIDARLTVLDAQHVSAVLSIRRTRSPARPSRRSRCRT